MKIKVVCGGHSCTHWCGNESKGIVECDLVEHLGDDCEIEGFNDTAPKCPLYRDWR